MAVLGIVAACLVLLCGSPRAREGPTTFQLEDKNGKAVATFVFGNREPRIEGLLFCTGGHRFLALFDRAGSVPPVLRQMANFPVEFAANGRTIGGHATYVAKNGPMPAIVYFALPLLDHQSFAGIGLALSAIANPQMSETTLPGERTAWADAVRAFSFRITATNGEQTLPRVFRDCST